MISSADSNHQSPRGGERYEVRSPIDGAIIASFALSDEASILRQIRAFMDGPRPLAAAEALAFLERLGEELRRSRDAAIAATILETGFIADDSREMVDDAIGFLATFRRFVEEQTVEPRRIRHSYSHASDREMSIEQRPFRCIAALVPQNASLTLAITIIAAAVYAGSKVVLRPSLQCGGSAVLLADAIARCQTNVPVLIVNSLATEFLGACHASDDVDVIHYMGSNEHALKVFVDAFSAKKACLLDGQGNGMLYVDSSFPLERAVKLITSGATRYNGETCTSVNGVLVEAQIYHPLRDALVERFAALRVGHPGSATTEIGPLFSHAQADRLSRSLREGETAVLCGGQVSGGYFTPCIVEGVARSSPLVREGIYGPAMWLQAVRDHEVFPWLRANTFPLSDTILSTRKELIRDFAANSRAARISVNGDPSIESMFEPWGGYPPSGWNPVSIWIDKYRQAFQLDQPLRGAANKAA